MAGWVKKANLRGPEGKQGVQGLPGVNATPADIATGGYVSTPGTSATKTAVIARIEESTQILSAARFGADPTGVVDATAAINAAFVAVPAGGKVIIPPGTYKNDGTFVNPTGKSFSVSAYGATFVKDTSTAAVRFEGGYDATVAVSALVVGVIAAANKGVTLTVSGTMPWVRGDIVKVFSDDVLPETLVDILPPASTTARSGQFFTVYSVSSNTVTLLGDLVDPLVTNIRAARMKNVTAKWEGGTFTHTDNYVASDFTQGGFTFNSLRGPVVKDVIIARSGSSAFAMVGCYGWRAENCEGNWVQDDSGAGQFGYGITDTVSWFGVADGCRFSQPRHGYTTNYSGTAIGDDSPAKHGRTFGAQINMIVRDSSNSAFDTHSDGENIEFKDCKAYNVGAGAGYHLRGRGNKVTNSFVDGAPIAVRFASDSDAGQSYGHVVDGLTAENVSTVVQTVTRGGGTHPDAGVRDPRSSSIRNVTARGVTLEGIDHWNTTTDVDNIYIEFVAGVTAAQELNSMHNAVMFAGRIRQHVAGLTGSGAYLFAVEAGGVCEITDLRVTGPAGMATTLDRIVNIVSGSPEIRMNILADYKPATGITVGSLDTNSWVRHSLAIGVSNGSSARTPLASATVAADLIQAIARRRDPVILLDFTLPGGQTLADLPNSQQGTILIISNLAGSGGSLTVANGSGPNTALTGGTSKVLAAGSSLMLAYVGGTQAWRQLNLV